VPEGKLASHGDEPPGWSLNHLTTDDVLDGLGRRPGRAGGFDAPDDPAQLIERRPTVRVSG
jgi:hypothetical protein